MWLYLNHKDIFKMFTFLIPSYSKLANRQFVNRTNIAIHISKNHIEKLYKTQNILGEVTIEMRGWYNLNN